MYTCQLCKKPGEGRPARVYAHPEFAEVHPECKLKYHQYIGISIRRYYLAKRTQGEEHGSQEAQE